MQFHVLGQLSAVTQDRTITSEKLKVRFLSAPAAGWGALFTEFKKDLSDSVVNGWREDAIKLYGEKEFEPAHKLIDVCLYLSNALHQTDLNGKCLLVKAEIYYFQEQYPKAIDFARRAGLTFVQSNDKFELARSKNRLAVSYAADKKIDQALAAFDEAIALKKQLVAEDDEYAESLYGSYEGYAEVLYREGHYDKEIEINKEAVQLAKKLEWTGREAYRLYSLGWTYERAKEKYPEAIPYFEHSNLIYGTIGDTTFLLYNYKELIISREAVGDSAAALTDADKAIALMIPNSKKNDANDFFKKFINRYKDPYHQKGLARFYEAREKLFAANLDSVVIIKTELAELYKTRKDYDKSIQKHNEILALPIEGLMRGDAYWNVALVYNEQADYKKEVENFKEAIKYYSKSENKHNQIVLLSNIGITYRNVDDSINSYKAHQEAIDLMMKFSDPTDPSYAYDKTIETYTYFKNYKRKVECMKMKFDLFQTLNDDTKSGEMAKLIGKEYEEALHDFDNANQYYLLSIDNYTKADDQSNMAFNYWNHAYNQGENKKDYKISLISYKKAERIYSYLKDTSNWKTILCNMALTYRNLGDSTNAFKTNQQAIDLTLKNSDPENLIYAYTKAIDTYDHYNNYKRKRAALTKKYEVYTRVLSQKLNQVKTLKNNDLNTLLEGDQVACGLQAVAVGKEYEKDPKDIKTANRYFLLAIEHYKKTSDKSGLATAHWNNAYDLDIYQKKKKEGIESYKKAIPLYAELKDTTNWKTLLCNVAIIYRDLRDSINSYNYHHQSIALTLNNSDPEELSYCYKVTAESYNEFKNFGKQMDILNKQLAIYEKQKNHLKIGEVLKAIGKVYEDSYKNYSMADAYYRKCLDQYNQTDDVSARANAYWSYSYNKKEKLNDYKEAINGFESAYVLFLQSKDTSNASVMRSNVAQTYWSMEDFEKAIQNHKEAIALAAKGKNQEMIAKSWNALADLYKKTDNPVKSTESLANAIKALEVLKDSTQLATAYASIASSYSKSQDYAQSFEFYKKAAAIRKNKKDTVSWASVLYDWGNAYYNKREYLPAEEKYKESLKLYRKIKSKSDEVYCLISLGLIEQTVNNDYKKAEPFYSEALMIAKAINNELILAYCYNQMKELYRNTGRTALADENSLKALEMYKKLKNWQMVAGSLSGLGYDTYYTSGDLAKAMVYYDQAQVIADTLSDKTVLASIFEGRATIYEERGEFTKSLEAIDKSYELYKSVYNEWGIAGTYIDRGNVYKAISEYETAMKFQNKADSMYLKMGTEYARLAPLANIGGNYSAQGNYPKGLEYSLKAFEIMKKAGDMNANLCIVKGNIGDIYYYLSNYQESDKWLKDALQTSRKVGAKKPMISILGELGRLKIDEKKYDEAELYLNEGLKTAKETGVTLGYLNNLILLGKLKIQQKQYDKAKVALDESYKICTTIRKDDSMWEALYLLGLLQKNTGNLPQSKEYLKESVKVIEKIRNKVVGGEEAQKLFSSDKNILNVYDALVEVLLALGETEEAMTYIQKNNEDNLKAKIKGLDVKFENEGKNKAVIAERSMKAKLDGIDEQIQKEKMVNLEKQNTEKLKNLEGVKTIAESEYLKFVNQQINVQPELSKFFNNSVQPTQFRKIKSKIPKDMALLSYLAGENQLYIFAATSDTVVAKVVTVSRAQLTKDINAMLNIIRNNMGNFSSIDLKTELTERKEIVNGMKQTDAMIKPFEDAYHYLIAPVSKEIAGKSRLGVIPTGALNYIPFQMLGKTLENGKFSLMMNQFAIFYANSTDMLFRDESETKKKYNILAFGNPDKSLPSTEIEVNDIKRMYPSASVFLREEATEDKAKYANESFNVMHFATHGNLDYEDFSKSFLTMAGNPSKSEDGKLTLEELWGMDVMTHLNIVVLSACQTAVTKGSNESSAVSPASGFLQNGVKSVVATLWKVDDEATSLLIRNFYNNIKTMDAVDALRSAQITLSNSKKFSHPYYWAAMVLLGDWR